MSLGASACIPDRIIDGNEGGILSHDGIFETESCDFLFQFRIHFEAALLVDPVDLLPTPVGGDARIPLLLALECDLYGLAVVGAPPLRSDPDIPFCVKGRA